MATDSLANTRRALVWLMGGLLAASCGDSEPGGNNGTDAAPDVTVVGCGNGILEPGEQCDGEEFGDQTCLTAAGHTEGTLRCTADCKRDVSRCHSCGNGAIERPEVCDTHDLAGQSCETLTGLPEGELRCAEDCSFDLSDCHQCGNGVVEGPEECDGPPQGLTCLDVGVDTEGSLRCRMDCTLDTSGCQGCGDGICSGPPVDTWHSCPQECGWANLRTRGHTCGIRRDGRLWCWGCNYYGQLGVEAFPSTQSPMAVVVLDAVDDVAVGGNHTCALARDGSVWCWGFNSEGEVGDGTTTPRPIPTQVSLLAGVVAIAAGSQHSCALRSDGRAWCWGSNALGQLGDGATTYSSMDRRLVPTAVVGVTDFTDLWAGGRNTCGLRADGSVWCWGSSGWGQLGNGSWESSSVPTEVLGLSSATQVSVGEGHVCAVLSDGTARCWGWGGSGQLGDGGTANSAVPVPVEGLTGVEEISAGTEHTCALLGDGHLWCWGLNDYGQLGDGTNAPQLLPARVPELAEMTAVRSARDHSCGIRGDGTLWCWGPVASPELGWMVNRECAPLGFNTTILPGPLCEGSRCGQCGNGLREPGAGEICDGADLAELECSDVCDYTGGPLACNASCRLDVGACTGGPVCGDGVVECLEACDGQELGGLTCEDAGYSGGVLGCDASCQFDTGGCTGFLGYLVETFELGAPTWTITGGWEVGTPVAPFEPPSAYGGSQCAATGIGSPYENGCAPGTCSLVSPTVSLQAATRPVLLFEQWIDTMPPYDGAILELSADGGSSWNVATCGEMITVDCPAEHLAPGDLYAWAGDYSALGWHRVAVDLSAYAGQSVTIRFTVFSDFYMTENGGWYVDDVSVTEAGMLNVEHRTTAALGTAVVPHPFSRLLEALFGSGSYQWTVQSGSNHGWLSVDSASGLLTGTPTGSNLGPGTITIRVADTQAPYTFADRTFTFDVVEEVQPPVLWDFEGTAPVGWTSTGTWEWGAPSGYGPGGCHGGSSHCVATNIDGYYDTGLVREQNALTTPPISLAGISTPLLVFYHYADIRAGDNGNLWVSTDLGQTWQVLDDALLTPGYVWTWLAPDSLPGFTGSPNEKAGWEPVVADLSAFVGQTVMFSFRFASGSLAELEAGWYIDDVFVGQSSQLPVHIESGTPLQAAVADNLYAVGLRASGGSGSYQWSIVTGSNHGWLSLDSGTGTLHGTPTAPNLGPVSVTVRVAEANDPANNFDESTFSLEVLSPLYVWDFDDTTPTGWMATGDWQWGVPSGGIGPLGCFTGSSGCWGTQMNGEHSNPLALLENVLVSPELDLTTATSPVLVFQQWIHTMGGGGAGGLVAVSTDGGLTWSTFGDDEVEPDYYQGSQCIGGLAFNCVYGGEQEGLGWHPVSVDLSAYAGGTVRLALAFRSSYSVGYPGWYVDHVIVAD